MKQTKKKAVLSLRQNAADIYKTIVFFYEKSRLLFNWFISKFGKIQPKSWRDDDKSIKSDRIATTVRGGVGWCSQRSPD